MSLSLFFFFNKFIYLFIYLFIYIWLHWVFVAACGLSLVVASGDYSLQFMGFSLLWLFLLWSMGSSHAGFSSCGLQALERRLSSCGSRAQLLHGMWDLPGPLCPLHWQVDSSPLHHQGSPGGGALKEKQKAR